MTDKKRPADPFAATVPPGGASPKQPAAPAPPSSDPRAFAVTGRADDADLKAALAGKADPRALAATGRAENVHVKALAADPLAATGFAQRAAADTHHAGLAGIDPLAATSHSAPAVTHEQSPPAATSGRPDAPVQMPAARKSRGALWAVLAMVIVGGGIAAAVLATSGKHETSSAGGSAQPGSAQPGSTQTGSAQTASAQTGSAQPAAAVVPASVDAATTADAAAGSDTGRSGSAASDAPSSLEALLAMQDKAIADGTSAPFEALLAPDVFGFGIDASEVRTGRDANYELVRHVIGMTPMTFTKKVWVGKADHGAWVAEVVTFADKHVVELTELASEHDGRWQIDAWHWALPLKNMDAYKLAKADKLAAPAVIPAAEDEDATVVGAVTAALNDRSVYVHAISPRPETFAFGSAPGEVMAGSAVVTRVFKAMDATFSVASGPYVKKVAPDLAFAAANVNFTNPAGTQTFRVLLVLSYADYWRIVQAHWSNGGPF